MKQLFACLFTLISINGHSQNDPEFRTNPNGLMYSESSMKKLREMVLDQNIKYKSCELSKPFVSHPQARVFSVYFKSEQNNLQKVLDAIRSGKSFNEVVSNFDSLVQDSDTTELYIQVGISTKKEKSYLMGSPSNGYSSDYIAGRSNSEVRPRSWVFEYSKPDKYTKNYSLSARYYPEPFEQRAIPFEYSKLIQYVDCMIDTNAHVFLTEKYQDRFILPDKKGRKKETSVIVSYIENKAVSENIHFEKDKQYTDNLLQYAETRLVTDTLFRQLFNEEVSKAIKSGKSNGELEFFAQKLGFKKEELQLMRCRRVIGFCSQDESPRLHALAIATAAGEVQQWDIFMRAHMDIMNDRFDRMSDGSYAWGRRKTYLKELEELDLNVTDIMLGMALRAANTSDNHYNGTVWRLGKAMAESKERKVFEQRAIGMIADSSLDNFNRGLIFLMLTNYIQNLEDVKEANGLIDSLRRNELLQKDERIKTAIEKLENIEPREDKSIFD